MAALEGIDLVHFLNQPGPVGSATAVDGRVVDTNGLLYVRILLGEPSGAARTTSVLEPHYEDGG